MIAVDWGLLPLTSAPSRPHQSQGGSFRSGDLASGVTDPIPNRRRNRRAGILHRGCEAFLWFSTSELLHFPGWTLGVTQAVEMQYQAIFRKGSSSPSRHWDLISAEYFQWWLLIFFLLFLSFLLYSNPVAGPLHWLSQMRTFLPYFLFCFFQKKISEKVIFLSLLTVSFSLSFELATLHSTNLFSYKRLLI